MRILQEALTFDDVLLVPAYSEVLPREVDLSTQLTRTIRLNLPVVSAAMDTVTEARLAIAIAQEGGIGIIHKSMTVEAQAREVARVKKYESGVVLDPITVSPDATLREVLELTRANGISGMPVVQGRQVVGIVTSRDLRFQRALDTPVSAVMTPKERLVTVPENTPRETVLDLFHKHRIEKVLVVGKNGELKGLVTVKDVQKATDRPRACKDESGRLRVGAAVGTSPDTLDRVAALVEAGVDAVVVDTSHGHSRGVMQSVERIKARFPQLQVIAGNIVTAEAARDLVRCGADAVKVGIGPGSICTTRIVAGVGIPQLTALYVARTAAKKKNVKLLADGGITKSGDIVKALTLADAVICGGILAGCREAPGEIMEISGKLYKQYRGMGSLAAMKAGSAARYGHDKNDTARKATAEGIEALKEVSGSLDDTIDSLIGGVQSGMGYLGAATLPALREKARYIRVSPAGQKEAAPHDVIEVSTRKN